MSQISFSGLASGLDSNAIVRKLVELERRPVLELQKRRTHLEQKQRLLGRLTEKLKALSTSADKARSDGKTASMKATVEGDALLASAGSAAKAGRYALEVVELAQPMRVASQRFTADQAGALGEGELRFGFSDGSETTVSFDANDSPSALAAKIESLDPRLRAITIDDGDGVRLVVTTADTGTRAAFTVQASGDSLGLEQPDAVVTAARDAELRYEGIVVRRPTNEIDDLVPGVKLRLERPGTVTLDVAPDAESARERLSELVETYNEVAKFLQGQLSHSGTQRGQDTLFGNSGLQALQRDLGRILTTALPSGTLGDYGLSLGRDGMLTLDEARLGAVLHEDPEALSSLLSGAEGLGAKMAAVADRFSRASGILSVQKATFEKHASDLTKQIERIEARIEISEARHHQRFAKLEQSIAMLEAQLASTGLLSTG